MPVLILPVEEAIEIYQLLPQGFYRNEFKEKILTTSAGPCMECGCVVRHESGLSGKKKRCPFFQDDVSRNLVQFRHTKAGFKLH